MLYCPKCQVLSSDGKTCPSCGGKKLREPAAEDPVLLVTTDETKAEMIEAVFSDHSLPFEERICGLGGPPPVIVGKSMYTNKNLFVPYGELETALALVNGVGILDAPDLQEQTKPEGQDDGEEETEKFNSRKRLIFRIASVVLFIFAVWGVVTVSDYAANALKELLSNII